MNDFVGGGAGTLISSAMLPTLKDYYVDLNDTYGTTANVQIKSLLGFHIELIILLAGEVDEILLGCALEPVQQKKLSLSL